jgi:hypothetical protein
VGGESISVLAEADPAPGEPARTWTWVLGAGVAPFAAGRLVPADGVGLPCPFREATGIPCPLCGATRAFALATRGDAGFLQYNAVAVAAAAVLVLAGSLGLVAALVRPGPARRLTVRMGRGRALLATAVGTAAVAWAWTLSHAGAITEA